MIFGKPQLERAQQKVDTGLSRKTRDKQKVRASVLIQSERILL